MSAAELFERFADQARQEVREETLPSRVLLLLDAAEDAIREALEAAP